MKKLELIEEKRAHLGDSNFHNAPLQTKGALQIRRLLLSAEGDDSLERCWNWRSPNLGLNITLRNRGQRYNGYPVSAGYFGAYSMDGLSMVLHCFYHTRSFNAAIERIVNLCGDADSTGSICGQIAGAFYGYHSIEKAWLTNLHVWDERVIDLRAIILLFLNCNK